jgi:hypothetical protein
VSATSAHTVSKPRFKFGVASRFAMIVLLAYVIGLALNRVATAMDQRGEPAGFSRGLLQGALMPCTLPTLLMGHDVTIYSVNNTGVLYKLGYTGGVNLCGAVFFGLFYRRLARFRRARTSLPAEVTT